MSNFKLQGISNPNIISNNNLYPEQLFQQPLQSPASSTNSYMWFKLIGVFIIIGIVIYIITGLAGLGAALSDLLKEMANTGKTFFQGANCTMEKFNCCINGCPGDTVACNASQIASMENDSGCNVCTKCSPPCYLPSYKEGISCNEWYALALGGLLAKVIPGIMKMWKRRGTKEAIKDEEEVSLELNEIDILEYIDIGEIENSLDEANFKEFDIEPNDKSGKKEIRDFMNKDPNELKESDIPESVKNKYNLEGEELINRCKQKINKKNSTFETIKKIKMLKKLKGSTDTELSNKLQEKEKQIKEEYEEKIKEESDNDYNEEIQNEFEEEGGFDNPLHEE
jgi:hypothetical protein